jgi:DNA-binding MarR family transcriptional regulator
MKMAPPSLQDELKKRRPFDLPEQEVYLNLLRTAGAHSAAFERMFRVEGLSGSTYNLLRILRGAADGGQPGLPCCEVSSRLVTQVPDMTRLVDRLEEAGLVTRSRSTTDRRVVLIAITAHGRELLAKLDEPVLTMHRQQLGHLTEYEMVALNELLVKARQGVAQPEGSE